MKPGLTNAIVENGNTVYVEGGVARRVPHKLVQPENFEEYRLGYRCLSCDTVQDEPFPEICKEVYRDYGRCGFRMRDEQLALLQIEDQGEFDPWPTLWTPS